MGQKQRDILRVVTLVGEVPESDLTRVRVFRGEQAFTVNVVAVREGDLKNNLILEPDDVVLVPAKEAIYVFGDVQRQGRLPWDSKLKLLDAIGAAGGLGPRANENGTILVRATPDGKTQVFPIRLGDLAKGEMVDNLTLEPGDIIYVPTLGERGGLLNTLRDLLWMATILVGLR
jgi:protein involved in polysaccharide export with SLBB domain